jgi:iron complex transport system ATP-binding protein
MKLTVSDINFAYNGHPILRQISFGLKPGALLCILGVNGAGKSTLLKCLNRILKPGSGSVLIGEENINNLSRNETAKRLGYVPQQHPRTRLSVFESVLMGRKPHLNWGPAPTDFALVEKLITQLGLEHLALRPVTDLSGGEMQKVAIARALAQTPEVLLLDEPTSNLDLKNQLEVMGLIRNVVENQGLSAVVAIHDLNLAVRYGDRFLFLKDHRVHSMVDRQALSAETIREVYGVDVILQKINSQTIVIPL